MNWTDNLISETDVFIQVNSGQVIVSFSNPPNPQVLGDLGQLNQKPGFSIERYRDSETDFLVSKPITYRPVVVAESIKNMLESHGLRIEVTSRFNY